MSARIGASSSARSRGLLVAAFALLALLASAPLAAAATFNVNDATDAPLSNSLGPICVSSHGGSCTLRAAVQAADNVGGANTINLPPGTFTLTVAPTSSASAANGDLDVTGATQSLTIAGVGASATIIDAGHIDRAFSVGAAATLSISGVTVRNGAQPNTGASMHSTDPGFGGAFYNDGTLSINTSVLTANSAVNGGVVGTDTAGRSTTITNSVITDDAASSQGGAIASHSGAVTLSGDSITNNSAGALGGVLASDDSTGTAGAVNVAGSTIAANVAAGGGGALYLTSSGTLGVTNTTLQGNVGGNNLGGAMYVQSSGAITIASSVVSANSAGNGGGGLAASNSTPVTVTSSTFAGDSAANSSGGAIAVGAGDLSVSGSIFSGDSASLGGAVYVDGTSATAPQLITTSSFTGNGAGGSGGAVYDSVGALTISRSTFSQNAAGGYGGALDYGSRDGLALTNDTFDGNQSGVEGGAIDLNANATSGSVTLTNDTIARNTAYQGGGIYLPANANTIQNTIVAGNSGGSSTSGGGDCYGAATHSAGAADLGGNIDGDGTCFAANPATHDLTGVTNPLLGTLSDNGGPTQTDALLGGSPAIGDGVTAVCQTVAIDQRGLPRPAACDSGAFQSASADAAIAVSAPPNVTAGSPLTYTLTVSNNGPGAATSVKVTDPLPPGTSYFSSSASQGSCSGTTTVICNLGTLQSATTGTAGSASVTIVVIPGQAGVLTDSASVSIAETDPTTANNVASVATTVGPGPSVNVSVPVAIAPTVTTGVASQVKSTTATLSAVVNPAGAATTYTFQRGKSTSYGTSNTAVTLAAGTTPKAVSLAITGLTPGTTYHFRIVATNPAGTSDGQDVTFTTPKLNPKNLTLSAARKRNAYTISGQLVRPSGVSAATGCTGTVTVQVAGRNNTAKLGKQCRYSVSSRLAAKHVYLITARFSGNAQLAGKTVSIAKYAS